MAQLTYIKGYGPHSPEAARFFALVRSEFRLDLSPLAALDWAALGYRCHTLLVGGDTAANVSALRMTLQVMGKPMRAIQLGAMTVAPAHRGKGLARELLGRVFEEYADLPMLLFANESVLDFYPRFGFLPHPQYLATVDVPQDTPIAPLPRRLACDSAEGKKRLSHPHLASAIMDARGNALALWANLHLTYPGCLYDGGAERAVLASQQGDTLHIYDVFAQETFDLTAWAAWPGVRRLCLHFTPDWLGLPYTWQPDPEEHLFLRGSWPQLPPFCFPATAKT